MERTGLTKSRPPPRLQRPDLNTDPTYVCRLIHEQLVPKVLRYGPDDPANMEDGTAEQMLFLGIDEVVPREIYRQARRRFLEGKLTTDAEIAAAARKLMKAGEGVTDRRPRLTASTPVCDRRGLKGRNGQWR